MKRVILKTSLFAVLLLPLLMGGFYLIHTDQRQALIQSSSAAFTAVVNLAAAGMNDGYFNWTQVQDAIRAGDIETAKSLLIDLTYKYPGVTNVTLENGVSTGRSYEISGRGREVLLRFPFMDDMGVERLDDWAGVVTMDAQTILDNVKGNLALAINPESGQPFAFGLRIRFMSPVLGWADILLVLTATFALCFPFAIWMYRRSTYFFESRGLESIIFLFEQSERLSATHSRRVAAFSVFLGAKMGYRKRRLRNLYTAALLHDIGKISIPPGILLKKGQLSPLETKEIQAHPLISAKILGNFRELAHLRPFVLYHHERIDGSGYPEGISGKEIPQEARIIAVVDVFDALSGDRPYRDPSSPQECFNTMRTMPIDQGIVEVFAAHHGEFKDYVPPRWSLEYDQGREGS